MTSNEIMINYVTIKVQYRVNFLRHMPFGIKITCMLQPCIPYFGRASAECCVQCREQGGLTWQKANDTIAISRPGIDQGILEPGVLTLSLIDFLQTWMNYSPLFRMSLKAKSYAQLPRLHSLSLLRASGRSKLTGSR
jgi:hypothetical protein